ncbi:hypothetical protein FRC20_011912 [Serendipita sp. 405]|nr:hypothetical protein FRC20_011912 [Serendipita sp. 405]
MENKEGVETFNRGLSHIFPAVPILAAISIVCCILVLRSFLKTHVFAFVYYLWLLIIGNALLLINTCVWRGSVVSIPIYADMVARFWQIYGLALYLSMLCLCKFIWIISRPAPSIKVYDTRRWTNSIDASICFGVPLLLAPLFFFASRGRYVIIEDLGPWFQITLSITAFVVGTVPIMVTAVISIIFSCLSCYNFWLARQSNTPLNETPTHQQRRILSVSQTYKYTYISITVTFSIAFGLIWVLIPWFLADYYPQNGTPPWHTVLGIQSNLYHYKETYELSRESLDQFTQWTVHNLTGFAFTIPIAGIQIFLCFGLAPESKRMYARWWCDSVHYMKDTKLYDWGEMLVSKAIRFRRPRVDHNNFTPFLFDDIIMEDLLSTSSDKTDTMLIRRSTLPLPPAYIPPTPHGAKSALSPLQLDFLNRGSGPTSGQQGVRKGGTLQQTPSPRSNSDHSLS